MERKPGEHLTPEEWAQEEWRRTCELTYDDIMRICSLGAVLATADLVHGEILAALP